MGLAGLCLERYDVWPTFPNRLSEADVSAGLVLPNTAVAIMGKGGAVATLLLAVSHPCSGRYEPKLTLIVHGHHEHVLVRAHLSLFNRHV